MLLPVTPDYIPVTELGAAHGPLLGAVTYGTTPAAVDAPSVALPMPQIAPPLFAEVWRSGSAVTRGQEQGIDFAYNDDALFGVFVSDGDDIESAGRRAYDALLAVTRRAGYPHLLRVWNHVRDINLGEGDVERYKQFCTGRHEAFTGAGWTKRELPSASAVGMTSGGFAMHFVASRTPAAQLENPRQVSAYDYPREYGPRSPSFSRASLARWGNEGLLFISGTAAVVGHATVHEGDVEAQLEETLVNLDGIAREAGSFLGGLTLVKTYVRNRDHYPRIAPRVMEATPAAKHLFLETDICRADLLLEIEAIAALRLA